MLTTSSTISVDVAGKMPSDVEAIAVFIHAGTRQAAARDLPAELHQAVERLQSSRMISGKANEVVVQLLEGKVARRLIVVGLGKAGELTAEALRESSAAIARAARQHKLTRVAIILPPLPEQIAAMRGASPSVGGVEAGIDALVTGAMLWSFDWTEYRGSVTKKKHEHETTALTLVIDNALLPAARTAARRAVVIAEGQNFARTIASRPGNDINPPKLADVARQLAKEVGLKIRVLDEKEMARLGMGGILAVGAGANRTPPRLIVLEHGKGAGGGALEAFGKSKGKSRSAQPSAPLLVVGKAITFDTGGISIKPADKMGRMVFDKCGAMAVLGLMYAVAKLQLPVNVVGILASAENHISETAYRPGDLLRMYNGVTVEVTNTDAEGRLVLGDALAWGIEQYKPAAVVDLATLTGGVVVALGTIWAGLMSNSDALSAEITHSATQAGEKVWRLPIGDEVRDLLKSDFADIINAAGRYASPLTGAAFLSYFVPEDGKTPWVHLDIAGVAETEKEMPYYGKGATGWGVRTLVNWVTSRQK